MDQTNANHHYISEVLLRRFRSGSERLYCFQVPSGQWRRRSTRNTCSATGYNQLLIGGEADLSIETEFSKIESKLPETLRFLDEVASSNDLEMPSLIHENLSEYCSFLKLISPIEKHGAIVALNSQINMCLRDENYEPLRELGVTNEAIALLRQYVLKGCRVTVEAKNLMQQAFCHQFGRLLPSTIRIFQNTAWTICNSPLDLPMSDIGIVPIHHQYLNAIQYLLPVGTRSLLEGLFFLDEKNRFKPSLLRKETLADEEAQNRADIICASALEEIVCTHKIADIPACIARAKSNGISFQKIVNPGLAKTAGIQAASSTFGFKIMSATEYREYSHSLVLPHEGVAG